MSREKPLTFRDIPWAGAAPELCSTQLILDLPGLQAIATSRDVCKRELGFGECPGFFPQHEYELASDGRDE